MPTRDVNYELREVEYMPKRANHPTPRTSQYSKLIEKVVTTPKMHNRPYLLADYGKNEGASAAAQNLRNRFGWQPSHGGWDFKIGRVETEEGKIRYGLFGIYDPSRVVEGEWEVERERRAAKRAERAVQASTPAEDDSVIERLMQAG